MSLIFTASAATYFVDGKTTGKNPTGESWRNAFPSLSMALTHATTNQPGQIWVRAGVYKPADTGRSSTFNVPDGTSIFGGFRGGETNLTQRNPKAYRTILSGDIGRPGSTGDNTYHVVTANGNNRIDGFIIQRGNANSIEEDRFGGGLRIVTGSKNVTVSDCTFEKNSAESGGAIHVTEGSLSISNSSFYSNSGDTGGAIATLGTSELNLTNSAFSSNFAPISGGAIMLNEGARVRIRNSSFLYNSTDGFGGGISARSTSDAKTVLQVEDCTFSENSARNDGGALGLSGPFSPVVKSSSFEKNFSSRGAGGIANESGTALILLTSTFNKNEGPKGNGNISNDAASSTTDSASAAKSAIQALEDSEEKAAVAPEPEARKIPDAYVHHSKDNSRLKLRSIAADAPYTVFVLGDLTDDGFIEHYRTIEAAARDFYPKGIRFYYLYKNLKHPENNGFVRPFVLRERAQHAIIAKERLQTAVPWLYDTMENQAATQLADQNSGPVFIFSAEGEEVYQGRLSSTEPFRSKLEELTAPVEEPFDESTLPEPEIGTEVETKWVARAEVSIADKFQPLEITPLDSRSPFYVKARVEADEALRETGDGRLYLGFHIDPLFKMQWNNLGEPLKYALKTPAGVVAPSISSAARVTGVATDSEPREFLLQARKLDLNKPLTLQVTYSIHTPEKRNLEVTQGYQIYLQKDEFGGVVIGRQTTMDRAKAASAAPNSRPSDNPYRSLLRRYDIDRNGKLTSDEVIGTLSSKFDEIDSNDDGAIDSAEYMEYRNNR